MNGLYIGTMGMLNYMQHINVHSNNITNSSTVGFKFDTLTSSVYKSRSTNVHYNNKSYGIGIMDNKVLPTGTHVNLIQGSTIITNSQTNFFLDDRIEGNTSFLVIERNGQQYLTRDGNFSLNGEGFLKTDMGDYVLDVNNQRIQLPTNENITVDTQGRIFDANGNYVTQLQTKAINSDLTNSLVKHADGRITLEGTNVNELPAGTAQVYNGMLETSNVDMASEMVGLIKNQKMVSSSQKIMTTFDKIYEKEANNLL